METSIARTFVGMDVHKDSISVALLRPGQEIPDQERIPNTPEEVRRLVGRWADPSAVRVCYEAGPTGYELQRQLSALDVDCVVIAPALTPRKPGDRVKTDSRDARKLCRLLRAGELTTIRIPPPDEEAVRDLLRLREDLGEDILRARHRLSKFLLRHGRVFREATAWTKAHWTWIRAQRFDLPLLERLRDEHVAAIEMRLAQRDSLERELHAIAAQPQYAERVARLSALRGVKTLTALTLLVEVGVARFGTAAQFMAFTGLVPSEYSSGASRHQGAITKTGNAHLRRVLVESAWAYRSRPAYPSERRGTRLGQPPAVLTLALASEQRLHRRYWRIVQRGQLSQVAAVAIARELAGVVWALMRPAPVVG